MSEFHERHSSLDHGRDPLERLVEAFVELSVPDGPDAAVQRRLTAALSREKSELAPAPLPQRTGMAKWRVGAFARQCMALAAGILVLVATALLVTARRQGAPNSAAPNGANFVAAAKTNNDALVSNDATNILDRYLLSDGAKPDLVAMLSVLLKERRELSKSPRWQKAQAQLSYALEKPEVIGLGVGLLGTLPLTSYGRF